MATLPRANLSREEPDAGNLHVRVCEGWGDNVPTYSALGVTDRRQVTPESCGFMQVTVHGEKIQRTSGECPLEVMQEQAPEHPRQHPDRQEKPRPARDPTLAIRRDPAAGYQAMKMRVVQQVLPPRVQHGQEADLCSEGFCHASRRLQRVARP